jgi:dihydrofolate reductase
MTTIPIISIIAVTPTWGIGAVGVVPWVAAGKVLKRDMQYFRDISKQTCNPAKRNIAVMGRKTWESIPSVNRPLKNRINIILSTTMEANIPTFVQSSNLDEMEFIRQLEQDIFVFPTFQDVIDWSQGSIIESFVEKIVVIGGSLLFEESFFHPNFHTLYLTQVQQEFPCDTFLSNKMKCFLEENALALNEYVKEDNIEEDGIQYR